MKPAFPHQRKHEYGCSCRGKAGTECALHLKLKTLSGVMVRPGLAGLSRCYGGEGEEE